MPKVIRLTPVELVSHKIIAWLDGYKTACKDMKVYGETMVVNVDTGPVIRKFTRELGIEEELETDKEKA